VQRKADLAKLQAAEEAAAKQRQDAIDAYEREVKQKAKEAEELKEAQLKKRLADAELAAQKIEVGYRDSSAFCFCCSIRQTCWPRRRARARYFWPVNDPFQCLLICSFAPARAG
jgi:hypothetical protein